MMSKKELLTGAWILKRVWVKMPQTFETNGKNNEEQY